jgi:hypothetical protein
MDADFDAGASKQISSTPSAAYVVSSVYETNMLTSGCEPQAAEQHGWTCSNADCPALCALFHRVLDGEIAK